MFFSNDICVYCMFVMFDFWDSLISLLHHFACAFHFASLVHFCEGEDTFSLGRSFPVVEHWRGGVEMFSERGDRRQTGRNADNKVQD